ncbi:MAG: methyltransferase domain-containing protein [Mycetocola sp.]
MSLEDPATGEVLLRRTVSFTNEDDRVEVTDVHGRWLAVNKWDRLGPNFEGDDSGIQERLVENGARLVAVLEELDYPVYIVGGTLLGAMRSGSLLPHDDDMDLAVFSEAKNPIDLALETAQMERQLQERGFVSVRHSYAHLQVTFFREDGTTDHYIDIFSGFTFDDEYGQPFALLGPEITKSDLLPPSHVKISGISFPAPRIPEAWLSFAYGPNWRVPDPSFSFVTPPSTIRRFETWFGVMNRQRVYWEKHYEAELTRPAVTEWERGNVQQFLDSIPEGASVIDLGSGDGRLTELIAAKAGEVVGIDYSYEAIAIAQRTAPDNVRYEYLNLNDATASMQFTARMIRSKKTWYVFANHVIHTIAKGNRVNVYRLLQHGLRGDGFAFLTFDTNLSSYYERLNPERWHFSIDWLRKETKRFELKPTVLEMGERISDVETRTTAVVRIEPFIVAAQTSDETRINA